VGEIGRQALSNSNDGSASNRKANTAARLNQKIRIDELDIKIIKELFNDPGMTSTGIANKHHEALSTIQRRRVKLEERLIKRSYTMDIRMLGWRTADLAISVQKGVAKQTAQELVRTRKENVIMASLRIGDPVVDIMADVFYRDSQELHDLIESVKAMPNVIHVEWSEVVEETESNIAYMVDKVLTSGLKQLTS
jgi:DNA-binding Lrp family transcriptional regulator